MLPQLQSRLSWGKISALDDVSRSILPSQEHVSVSPCQTVQVQCELYEKPKFEEF